MKKRQKNRLEFYKSKGNIYWRVYRQGRIIAGSTEGYKRLAGAKNNLLSVYHVLDWAIFDTGYDGEDSLKFAIQDFKQRKGGK